MEVLRAQAPDGCKSPYEMTHFLKGHVCLLGSISIDLLVVSLVSYDRSKRAMEEHELSRSFAIDVYICQWLRRICR